MLSEDKFGGNNTLDKQAEQKFLRQKIQQQQFPPINLSF